MTIRKLLAALFVAAFGAAPVFAQVCPYGSDRGGAYEVVVVAPPASYPLSTYGNPCAPYGWCGARDAWGNPVYTVPSHTAYPDVYGYGHGAGTVVYESVLPRVNGWTGVVEYHAPNAYDGLIAY